MSGSLLERLCWRLLVRRSDPSPDPRIKYVIGRDAAYILDTWRIRGYDDLGQPFEAKP